MEKKSIIRIVIGSALFVLTGVIVNCGFKDLRFNPWLPVVYGVIVIPSIFPPVIRWAIATKQKHKALSLGLIALLGFWTLGWLVYVVLTVIGVAR